MDDANVHVAQRATLYMGAIHDKAIEVSNKLLVSMIISTIFFLNFLVCVHDACRKNLNVDKISVRK